MWREVRQVMEESDVILSDLDASELELWAHGKLLEKSSKKTASNDEPAPAPKPIILVLNKTDLVPYP